MHTEVTGLLAVQVSPHSPTQWMATYYPVVATPAGHQVEITMELHQQPLPTEQVLQGPVAWLEADTTDPGAACYAAHPRWATHLAGGYARALAVYDTETIDVPCALEDPEGLRRDTIVVAAEHLPDLLAA